MIKKTALTTLSCVLVCMSPDALVTAEELSVVIVGSDAFNAKVRGLAVTPERARHLAVDFDASLGWPSRCELTWCVGDEYVFVRFPEKLGIPIYGIYVNGRTGKCRYVSRTAAGRVFKNRFPTGVVGPKDVETIRTYRLQPQG